MGLLLLWPALEPVQKRSLHVRATQFMEAIHVCSHLEERTPFLWPAFHLSSPHPKMPPSCSPPSPWTTHGPVRLGPKSVILRPVHVLCSSLVVSQKCCKLAQGVVQAFLHWCGLWRQGELCWLSSASACVGVGGHGEKREEVFWGRQWAVDRKQGQELTLVPDARPVLWQPTIVPVCLDLCCHLK